MIVSLFPKEAASNARHKPVSIMLKGNKILKHKLIVVFVVALLCYFWGAITVYKRIFPFAQLRALKNMEIGGSVHAAKPPKTFFQTPDAAKPLYTFFQTFSPKSDIVMIGDSITQEAFWNEIFTNVKIANRGVAGDTTYDILRRMDTILSVSPKKAFVMVGINDISRGVSIDEIFNNYVSIVKELQGKNITVYIQSTLECQKSKCGIKLRGVQELNRKLNRYAAANNIKYININEGLTNDTRGLLSDYTPDGIHLNGKGYLVWRKTISPYVNLK